MRWSHSTGLSHIDDAWFIIWVSSKTGENTLTQIQTVYTHSENPVDRFHVSFDYDAPQLRTTGGCPSSRVDRHAKDVLCVNSMDNRDKTKDCKHRWEYDILYYTNTQAKTQLTDRRMKQEDKSDKVYMIIRKGERQKDVSGRPKSKIQSGIRH